LKGNRFSVALRFIDAKTPDEVIIKNMEQVQKNGFINYFGMQRFGSYSVRTHQLGLHILNHNWKQLIKLILQQHVDYDSDEKERKQKIVNLVFGEEAESMSHTELKERIKEAMECLDKKDRLEKTIL
jgi:TruD family tRNA pseudouridine synthase